MRSFPVMRILPGILLVCGLSASVAADDYRLKKVPAVHMIYESMLMNAQKGDKPQVTRSLDSVKDVCDAIKSKFKADVEGEIRARLNADDKAALELAIRKLIWYDLKDIFSILRQEDAKAGDPKNIRKLFIIAQGDAKELMGFNQDKISFEERNALKDALNRGTSLTTVRVSAISSEKVEKSIDFDALYGVLKEIEDTLARMYPEFKS